MDARSESENSRRLVPAAPVCLEPRPESTSAAPDLSARALRRWGIVLLAVGAALRLFRLDALPPWNDECIQLNGIQTPFSELRVRHLFTIDHMPPFSYWIQRLFWRARPSLYAARLPGALAGIAMIPLAAATLRRSVSRTASAAAAAFTAVLFFLVYYSQECRAYIFFGLGIWLFLGVWMRLLNATAPPRGRDAGTLFGAALLCAAFHFSTTLLLACTGMATLVWVAADRSQPPAVGSRMGRAVRRVFWVGAACLAALGATGLMMRYFLGPKTAVMMARARETAAAPDAATLARTLARLTFGNGWRLAPFFALWLAGLAAPRPATRRAAWMATLLFAVSVVGAAWIFPGLGFWSFRESAPRYFFWWSWCVVVALSAGVERLAACFRRPAGAHAALALATAAALAAQAAPFHHYFHSDSKWFNVRAFRSFVESLGAPRTVVLYNAYDMHQLQCAWPSNAMPAAPPFYEPETYETLNIRGWIVEAAERFPNVLIKSSWHRSFEPELEQRLRTLFRRCERIENNAHSRALAAFGLRQLELVSSDIYWNEEVPSHSREAGGKSPAWLFPGNLPIVGVRRPEGDWELWRGLDRPSIVRRYLDPDADGRASASPALPVARLVPGGALRMRRLPDGPMERHVIEPAPVQVCDPDGGAPRAVAADAGALERVAGRVRMNVERAWIPWPPTEGLAPCEVELTPEGAPLLLGAPP